MAQDLLATTWPKTQGKGKRAHLSFTSEGMMADCSIRHAGHRLATPWLKLCWGRGRVYVEALQVMARLLIAALAMQGTAW